MIEMFEGNLRREAGSSKGNQLKWFDGTYWYKSDSVGYEGLAEYVCARILREHSTLPAGEVTAYETVEMRYKTSVFLGCKSKNILPEGWQLITLERLIKQQTGRSIGADLYRIPDIGERFGYLADMVSRITGLAGIGAYLAKMLTMDALFLNEDRHTHNIAVLQSGDGRYHLCPFFDQGAALLSDTTMDYPLGGDVYSLMKDVKARTLSESFEESLEAAEKACGISIKFNYDYGAVTKILQEEPYYDMAVKERVRTILMEQRRRYAYLFA